MFLNCAKIICFIRMEFSSTHFLRKVGSIYVILMFFLKIKVLWVFLQNFRVFFPHRFPSPFDDQQKEIDRINTQSYYGKGRGSKNFLFLPQKFSLFYSFLPGFRVRNNIFQMLLGDCWPKYNSHNKPQFKRNHTLKNLIIL